MPNFVGGISQDHPTDSCVLWGKHLEQFFEMTYRPSDIFIGIEITRNREERKIYISQVIYGRGDSGNWSPLSPQPSIRTAGRWRFRGESGFCSVRAFWTDSGSPRSPRSVSFWRYCTSYLVSFIATERTCAYILHLHFSPFPSFAPPGEPFSGTDENIRLLRRWTLLK